MLINLLPHRAQPLPPARRRWWREVVLTLLSGLVIGAALGGWQQHAARTQQQQAHAQAAALQAVQQQHTALSQEVKRLEARWVQLQQLQAHSTQALAVLQAWVPALPPGVVVQSVKQEHPASAAGIATWLVQGVAPPDDSVANWLQHLPQALQGELLELRSSSWPQGSGPQNLGLQSSGSGGSGPQGLGRVAVQHFTVRLQLAGG